MSAASSPNPSNLILLAVIGIGAYWFMSRRAVAGPYYAAQPNSSAQKTQMAGALLNSGLNALGSIFGSSGQKNPIAWDNLTNDMPVGWIPQPLVQADGIVINNPGSSPYDYWLRHGTGGD